MFCKFGMDKRFGVQYLILDLKTLSDSEDFMFSGINSAPRFIMDSVPKKTVLSFCLVYGHHFWVHRQGFPKIWKISFFIVGDYYYYPFYYPSLLLPFLTLYISISKYCKFFWCKRRIYLYSKILKNLFYGHHILFLMLFRGICLFSYLIFYYKSSRLKGSN